MEEDQNKVNGVRTSRDRDVCVMYYCTGPDSDRFVDSVEDADASIHLHTQPIVRITYWLLETCTCVCKLAGCYCTVIVPKCCTAPGAGS